MPTTMAKRRKKATGISFSERWKAQPFRQSDGSDVGSPAGEWSCAGGSNNIETKQSWASPVRRLRLAQAADRGWPTQRATRQPRKAVDSRSVHRLCGFVWACLGKAPPPTVPDKDKTECSDSAYGHRPRACRAFGAGT